MGISEGKLWVLTFWASFHYSFDDQVNLDTMENPMFNLHVCESLLFNWNTSRALISQSNFVWIKCDQLKIFPCTLLQLGVVQFWPMRCKWRFVWSFLGIYDHLHTKGWGNSAGRRLFLIAFAFIPTWSAGEISGSGAAILSLWGWEPSTQDSRARRKKDAYP